MSPHPGLRALTNYVAVLVPAFTDQGTDAWDADGNLAPASSCGRWTVGA